MTMGARAIFIGTNAIDYSDIRTAVRNFMPPINWLQRGLKAGLKAIVKITRPDPKTKPDHHPQFKSRPVII